MINKLIITSYSDLSNLSEQEILLLKEELNRFAESIPSYGEAITTHTLLVGIDTTREQTRIQYDYIKA